MPRKVHVRFGEGDGWLRMLSNGQTAHHPYSTTILIECCEVMTIGSNMTGSVFLSITGLPAGLYPTTIFALAPTDVALTSGISLDSTPLI
jgi:hypothetical protein